MRPRIKAWKSAEHCESVHQRQRRTSLSVARSIPAALSITVQYRRSSCRGKALSRERSCCVWCPWGSGLQTSRAMPGATTRDILAAVNPPPQRGIVVPGPSDRSTDVRCPSFASDSSWFPQYRISSIPMAIGAWIGFQNQRQRDRQRHMHQQPKCAATDRMRRCRVNRRLHHKIFSRSSSAAWNRCGALTPERPRRSASAGVFRGRERRFALRIAGTAEWR